MTRKGLIVVEQMPVLWIRTLIQAYMGVFTSSDHECAQALMTDYASWHLLSARQ